MRYFVELKYRLSKLIIPAALSLFLFYIYYQMITGNRGLVVWYNLNGQVEMLKRDNLALEEQLNLLHARVAKLDGEHFDGDYMEELILKTIPMAYSNDKIIYNVKQ